MIENPALSLYKYWREVIRFHNEQEVAEVRKDAATRPNPGMTRPDRYSEDRRQWARTSARAPLNYRLALAVTGVSANHVDAGMIEPTFEEYEPVITMNVRAYRSTRYPLMTLYPNGDFRLDDLPSCYYQIFPYWTFFQTSYAAGRRVWMLPQEEEEVGSRSWSRLDEKDWQAHRLYVPNYSFKAGCNYRLVADKEGRWKFATTGRLESVETNAAKLLAEGYDVCERRYARNRRMSERTISPDQRSKLALYVSKHGRMTGDEAVLQMVNHMRVYPALRPQEAPNGNGLVTSPVHNEAGVVTG